ncbi:hypothetical protein IF129_24810 [Streptomyces chumphonensis]|uniref:Uncharacterized protein n=1 Tax=Streptomyces chumphonensis TaxID=1214925 RepID=A0A927IFT5_9ACTN|nr:hypothetical protein [Streptomyces chumphonensis]MBD3934771.1 hypothetical protein [Streptomyces chumphonensis]
MVDAHQGGGGTPSDFRRAAESLKDFKKRVDGIIENLEKSAASRTSISANAVVPKASYGTGFSEAEDLSYEYERIHEHLTALSQTFTDQIDAMGIAVLGADIGFDNLEEDLKRRFWEIRDRAKLRYEEDQTVKEGGDKPTSDVNQGL